MARHLLGGPWSLLDVHCTRLHVYTATRIGCTRNPMHHGRSKESSPDLESCPGNLGTRFQRQLPEHVQFALQYRKWKKSLTRNVAAWNALATSKLAMCLKIRAGQMPPTGPDNWFNHTLLEHLKLPAGHLSLSLSAELAVLNHSRIFPVDNSPHSHFGASFVWADCN